MVELYPVEKKQYQRSISTQTALTPLLRTPFIIFSLHTDGIHWNWHSINYKKTTTAAWEIWYGHRSMFCSQLVDHCTSLGIYSTPCEKHYHGHCRLLQICRSFPLCHLKIELMTRMHTHHLFVYTIPSQHLLWKHRSCQWWAQRRSWPYTIEMRRNFTKRWQAQED